MVCPELNSGSCTDDPATINSSTVGTTGSHALGDRVSPVTTRAVVGEGRIQTL
jgi:hypothetical protein